MLGRPNFPSASLMLLLASGLPLTGCGAGSSPTPTPAPSLLGTWETKVDPVTISVTFTGSAASGTATAVQSTPVSDDRPTCHVELTDTGSYHVAGTSVTLTASGSTQRISGCSTPDLEGPGNQDAASSFFGALSGPFILNDSELRLGNSYPTFTRK